MAYEFNLPDIGEGLTEADVVRWLVPVGESVDVDQVLVEVETAKAVVEMPAPVAGVVLHHGAAEGETLEVGSILCVIGEAGEAWGDDAPTQEPAGEKPLVGSLSDEAEVLPERGPGSSAAAGPVRALPIVRKLAKEHGVDLTTISGSGPDGRSPVTT